MLIAVKQLQIVFSKWEHQGSTQLIHES